MDTQMILEAIDAELARLMAARSLLQQAGAMSPAVAAAVRRGPGRPRKQAAEVAAMPRSRKGGMSAEGRARIAAAQKARWARVAAAAKPARAGKKAAPAAAKTAAKPRTPKVAADA